MYTKTVFEIVAQEITMAPMETPFATNQQQGSGLIFFLGKS